MGKTILLVEDDADSQRIYRDALVERGYRVVVAKHGAEGVHMARRERPDLILLDLRMPVMDGYDAIRYLKTDDATARIPVWAVSAYLTEEGEESALLKRFDRLIPKPIDPSALVSEIATFLGPLPPQPTG